MRRTDKKVTDPQVIEEILSKSELCRLGLVDNGEAYIVPVNYGYKGNVIYIHSALEGRKIDILRKNSAVTFEITYSSKVIENDIACKWGTRYRSVMGRGNIQIETDANEKRKGLDIIMKKHNAGENLVYDDAVLVRLVLLKLTITSITAKQSGKWD
jgi:hypothetical protein